MTGLEIALFVLGAAFIIISFFIVDNVSQTSRTPSDKTVAGDTLRRISADAIEEMNHRSDLILADTEDKLESLSNDKIIAVGEYSDQILEKIGANHKEVVFLYQMLNEKEDSLKSTAARLENMRIECEKLIKSEVSLEVQRSNDTALPHIGMNVNRKNSSSQSQSDGKDTSPGRQVNDPSSVGGRVNTLSSEGRAQAQYPDDKQISGESRNTSGREKAAPQASVKAAGSRAAVSASKTSSKTASRTVSEGNASGKKSAAAAGTKTVKKTVRPGARISIEAEGKDNASLSRNEEIISLYREGKSVMEISKLLAMGQGEVKLIINLYG